MTFRVLSRNFIPKLSAALLFLTSCSSTGSSQEQRDQLAGTTYEAIATSNQPEWPKQLSVGNRTITVHQPQPEAWKNSQLKQRAVVTVQTPSDPRPIFGVIKLEAETKVDSDPPLVRFKNIRVTEVDFPSDLGLSQSIRNTVQENSADLLQPMALDRLRTELAISHAEKKRNAPTLKNDPPNILFSETPAVLVLVDGQPVLRETEDEDVLRVINTRVLLLLDKPSGKYFLHLGDGWMKAPGIMGPWSRAKDPPDSLKPVKDASIARKDADLLDDPRSPLAPKVYVSTEPAELLQTQGVPGYRSIEGTRLLYVVNTRDTLLLNEADQSFYVLLSGRWFRARSLDGPWSHVPARKLPADFAKIPENHRKGPLLAAVAGTPQAREAAISNDVPRTAKVDRRAASLEVRYDGTPRFETIEGTPLRYAVNSAIPILEVDSSTYYALRAGVWFVATAPMGPWSVATRVPPVIYTIPPSSPMYHVTFVRIYDVEPEYVYVGYTPGYLGSYTASDGVVVFGTGYPYPSWTGTIWIGAPWTFGFGFGWGWASGWGFGWPYAWGYYPWWSPWWVGGPVVYYGPAAPSPTETNPSNVYQNWSGSTVAGTSPEVYNTPYLAGGSASAWQPYQPDSGKDAGVSGWSPAAPATLPPTPASREAERARAEAFSGGSSQSDPQAGQWNPEVTAPPPPPPPAPPPPAPPPPPPAPSGGHPAGQSFPGGGWGPAR